MNNPVPPPPAPLPAVPVQPPAPPAAARARRPFGCLLPITLLVLALSLLGNVILGVAVIVGGVGSYESDEPERLKERFYLGDKNAHDKIAVVRLDGLISEFTIGYAVKQLEKAAKDNRVRAVVLRIDSPGGTVTASEELYQTVVSVRDGTERRFKPTGPKPVAVSMGSLTASGGYYVASAGSPIAAERTTITGSIGVFAMLPNVAELAHNHGVRFELVKAGAIKGSGSFFHSMSPEERQTWQDTVDQAYEVFLERIAAGRPGLTKDQLRSEVVIDRTIAVRDEKGNPITVLGLPVVVRYTRVRADGGTFTPDEALKFGLIDKIEDLPAVIRAVAKTPGIGSFKAVVYDRPAGLLDLVLGRQVRVPQPGLDLRDLSTALTPRLWYLAPSAEGGILTVGH